MALHEGVFRGFPADALALDFDLKNPLLSDVLLSPADIHAPERFQPASRFDFLSPQGGEQSTRSPTNDELWVPGSLNDELDSSSGSEGRSLMQGAAAAYSPMPSTTSFYHASAFSALASAAQPVPAADMHSTVGALAAPASDARGPVAAPFAAFPNVDALHFKRVKLDPDSLSPASDSAFDALDDQDEEEEEYTAPTPPPAATTHESPLPLAQGSARAARAASRGKRSPTSDQEFTVPFSPRGTDTRRRKAERQAARVNDSLLTDEERLEKNRRSARDCRLRKKRYIESLERRLAESESRETILTQTIARLQDQIALLSERRRG